MHRITPRSLLFSFLICVHKIFYIALLYLSIYKNVNIVTMMTLVHIDSYFKNIIYLHVLYGHHFKQHHHHHNDRAIIYMETVDDMSNDTNYKGGEAHARSDSSQGEGHSPSEWPSKEERFRSANCNPTSADDKFLFSATTNYSPIPFRIC